MITECHRWLSMTLLWMTYYSWILSKVGGCLLTSFFFYFSFTDLLLSSLCCNQSPSFRLDRCSDGLPDPSDPPHWPFFVSWLTNLVSGGVASFRGRGHQATLLPLGWLLVPSAIQHQVCFNMHKISTTCTVLSIDTMYGKKIPCWC